MNDLNTRLDAAVAADQLCSASRKNILELLSATTNPVYHQSVQELVLDEQWTELKDRFFRTLAFGTGGLRGRTIGKVVTKAEQGNGGPLGRPEHPCTGTNAMNFFNVSRAVRGMIACLNAKLAAAGESRRLRLVFGYDSRHFSRDFASFCAKIAVELGCEAHLFAEDRSTPELSFAIRHLRADGGAMITASHNPSHDNGFKAYFDDGAQLVPPYDTQVIECVNAINSESYDPVPQGERGTLSMIGPELDELYVPRLKTLVLDPGLVQSGPRPKVVYTNLHGTGGRIVPRLLAELGCEVRTVAAQDGPDGRFPTVVSPNPENASALKMAVEQAEAEGADIVIGTDPDCDRMGVAARDVSGNMVLLTGNEVGSLLAYYRIRTLIEQGVITDANRERACMIKTFVTSELQSAIARHYGISYVNTLTGFKWIGAKLRKYEEALPKTCDGDYRDLPFETSRALRLEHSRFLVVSSEESYGYLGHDDVRDKDGNGAVVMFVEMACHALSLGLTVPGLMENVFKDFGYFTEKNYSIYFEGAEGADKIKRLARAYAETPPTLADGARVSAVRNFNEDVILDEEGEVVPKEAMLAIDLEDGRSFNVRPSGTEPKIKYYLFGQRLPTPGRAMTDAELSAARTEVDGSLARLWKWIEADAHRRVSTAD